MSNYHIVGNHMSWLNYIITPLLCGWNIYASLNGSAQLQRVARNLEVLREATVEVATILAGKWIAKVLIAYRLHNCTGWSAF